MHEISEILDKIKSMPDGFWWFSIVTFWFATAATATVLIALIYKI